MRNYSIETYPTNHQTFSSNWIKTSNDLKHRTTQILMTYVVEHVRSYVISHHMYKWSNEAFRTKSIFIETIDGSFDTTENF